MQRKQLLMVFLVAAITSFGCVKATLFEEVGTEATFEFSQMRGLNQLHTPKFSSGIAAHCNSDYTDDCAVLNAMIIRAMDHDHKVKEAHKEQDIISKKLKAEEEAWAKIESPRSKKIIAERCNALRQKKVDLQQKAFLETLSQEEGLQLDNAIDGLLRNIPTNNLKNEEECIVALLNK